jgi:hypothetical protein
MMEYLVKWNIYSTKKKKQKIHKKSAKKSQPESLINI